MHNLKGSDDMKITRTGTAMFGRSGLLTGTFSSNVPLAVFSTMFNNDSYNIVKNSDSSILLKKNIKYEIEFQLICLQSSISSGLIYSIYNSDTGLKIGSDGFIDPVTDTVYLAGATFAKAFFTPSMDTNIDVRFTGTQTVSTIYLGTKIIIKEIETYTTLVPEILNRQLGINQVWKDVTASRVFGTTYTNTTGKPIEVVLGIDTVVSTVGYIIPTINGVAGTNFGNNSTSSGSSSFNASYIIPVGGTYLFTKSGTGVTYYKWIELS